MLRETPPHLAGTRRQGESLPRPQPIQTCRTSHNCKQHRRLLYSLVSQRTYTAREIWFKSLTQYTRVLLPNHSLHIHIEQKWTHGYLNPISIPLPLEIALLASYPLFLSIFALLMRQIPYLSVDVDHVHGTLLALFFFGVEGRTLYCAINSISKLRLCSLS